MELKEKEKLKKLKKNLKHKKNPNAKDASLLDEPKEELNVFEFINNTLSKQSRLLLIYSTQSLCKFF